MDNDRSHAYSACHDDGDGAPYDAYGACDSGDRDDAPYDAYGTYGNDGRDVALYDACDSGDHHGVWHHACDYACYHVGRRRVCDVADDDNPAYDRLCYIDAQMNHHGLRPLPEPRSPTSALTAVFFLHGLNVSCVHLHWV